MNCDLDSIRFVVVQWYSFYSRFGCLSLWVVLCKLTFTVLYAGLLEEAGAMANASTDLDNAEAQRQLNNNNRPASTGFWETETTSAKLFECSRIKALAGKQKI